MSQIKNSIESLTNRVNQGEDRLPGLEGKVEELDNGKDSSVGKQKQNTKGLWGTGKN